MLRAVIILAVACVAACSADRPALTATNVDVPAPVPGASMGAAYLELTNNSDADIRITRVASPQLKSVEMHETVLADGVSRMRRLEEVNIAPQQSVQFERGAKHLMLRYPTESPAQLTLQFYTGDTLMLSLDVSLKD